MTEDETDKDIQIAIILMLKNLSENRNIMRDKMEATVKNQMRSFAYA